MAKISDNNPCNLVKFDENQYKKLKKRTSKESIKSNDYVLVFTEEKKGDIVYVLAKLSASKLIKMTVGTFDVYYES